MNRTYKRPNVNIVRYLCSNDLLNVYLENGISGFISKIDKEKSSFPRLKLDNQEVGAVLGLYSNELGLFLNALSNEKLSIVRLFKLIKELSKGLIESKIVDFYFIK